MSDELRLPDDLAACEAQLAAQSLPPSSINRDELMYRAGWAACEARASVPISVSSPIRLGKRRWTTVAWSFASAATAASLAVAMTLQMVRPQPRGAAIAVSQSPALSQQATTVDPSGAQANDAALAKAYLASIVRPRRFSSAASLLAQRDQALQLQWRDLPIFPVNVRAPGGEASAPAGKTSRQMLDEFAPRDRTREKSKDNSPRRIFTWPWNDSNQGETI